MTKKNAKQTQKSETQTQKPETQPVDAEAAQVVEEKVTRVQLRAMVRVEKMQTTIANHLNAVNKIETKLVEYQTRVEKRIASIRAKGDPRAKRIAKLARLQAQIEKLQAELES